MVGGPGEEKKTPRGGEVGRENVLKSFKEQTSLRSASHLLGSHGWSALRSHLVSNVSNVQHSGLKFVYREKNCSDEFSNG